MTNLLFWILLFRLAPRTVTRRAVRPVTIGVVVVLLALAGWVWRRWVGPADVVRVEFWRAV